MKWNEKADRHVLFLNFPTRSYFSLDCRQQLCMFENQFKIPISCRNKNDMEILTSKYNQKH